MTIEIRTRPIDVWPGQLLEHRYRNFSDFRSTYTQTLQLLKRELYHLSARDCVVQLAYREMDFRIDGSLRAKAPSVPAHPGVILTFTTSRHGAMKYWTDLFKSRYHDQPDWHQNLRAIALGLEALRTVSRYGITHNDEQYTGWKAIGAGIAMGPVAHMTIEEAARIVAGATDNWAWQTVRDEAIAERMAYREATKLVHPDHAGDDPEAKEKFQLLQQAHQILVESFK